MAGLIPQSFIDDLLHRTDIVEVVARRVPDLKKKGRNHSACCPFHQEKTPSFSVNEDRQFYYCFGCGAGGNAIGFVMEFEQQDFPQAVESLARDAGMEVPREESAAATRRQSENNKLMDVLDKASKFYQQQLRQNSQRQAAVDYLKSRGVSGEIARDFGLGFSPPGWDNLLNSIGSDTDQEQMLLKAGLIIERESRGEQDKNDKRRPYYDRFRHRIMFPIRDTRGRTVAFGGRVLGDDKPKYLNSPETPVFHKGSELYGLFEAKKASSKLDKILIVEGYMDVIALAQMNIRNAVATLGTATSSKHLTRLFRLVSEVVFCFDGDEAGRTAAWRALEATLPLLEDGRQVRFLFLPEGADPDTYVREVGQDAFLAKVAEATPLEEFFYDKLSQGINTASIEGKARLSNLAKPLLRKLPRGIYAQLMLDRLTGLLGVSHESIDQLLQEQPEKEAAAPPAPADHYPDNYMSDPGYGDDRGDSYADSGQSRGSAPYGAQDGSRFRRDRRPAPPTGNQLAKYRKSASLKAIELLLRNPEVALNLDQDLELLRSAEDESRRLLLSLIEMVRSNPHTETYTLLGYCYDTSLGSQLTQLLNDEKITPQEGVEREFNQIIDNILSDIRKKLDLLQLKHELKTRVSSAKDQN